MLNTIFMGTPEIVLPSLSFLSENKEINLLHVISQPSRPSGRNNKIKDPPAVTFCKEKNIPLHQTKNINREISFLKKLGSIDLIVVFAFSQFLSKEILSLPKIGCFNIHTSLLPKYRGAAPIQYAILNQEKTTGVTIQKMEPLMDSGDVALQKEIEISNQETGASLYQKLMTISPQALKEFISLIQQNKLSYIKQNSAHVSFAPIIKKSLGHINFLKDSAETIEIKTRALYPWPGTFFFINNKRIKILNVEINLKKKLSPGEINLSEKTLTVGTTTNSIRIATLQAEGKKTSSDLDFINGLKESKLQITQKEPSL